MIDTDKYDAKKKRNWKLKVTYPNMDDSVEAFNGYDTDMVTQGYEDIIAVDSLGRKRYTVAQMVDTGWEDAQLIADAPLLLAEVKRLRWALAYTASLLTCRIEGDDIPVTDIREYALDVVDMTVDEAMATTDLMEESE